MTTWQEAEEADQHAVDELRASEWAREHPNPLQAALGRAETAEEQRDQAMTVLVTLTGVDTTQEFVSFLEVVDAAKTLLERTLAADAQVDRVRRYISRNRRYAEATASNDTREWLTAMTNDLATLLEQPDTDGDTSPTT